MTIIFFNPFAFGCLTLRFYRTQRYNLSHIFHGLFKDFFNVMKVILIQLVLQRLQLAESPEGMVNADVYLLMLLLLP